jgi:MFS family permease
MDTNQHLDQEKQQSSQTSTVGRGTSMLGGVFTAAWVIAGVAVLATIACLLTIPMLGPAPGNPWAASILYLLAPGLLIPFSLFMISRAGTYWLDEKGEWFRPAGTELAARIGISLAFVMVGLAACIAGLAPFEDFMPGSWDNAGGLVVGAFAALFFLAILISAVAGAAIVAGWKGTPAALLLAAGFGSICTYALTDENAWEIAAYTLLAASVAWFYAVGIETGWLPDFHRAVLGHWLTGGLAAAAVASVLWTGVGFFAMVGLCVLAAWIPLQLPRTSGVYRPAAEKRRPVKSAREDQERKQRASRLHEKKQRSRQQRTRRQRS